MSPTADLRQSVMRKKQLQFPCGFHVVMANRRAQTAQMTISPGESEGGPGNRHQGADQWLYVVSGRGLAIVNKKRNMLREGTLLLIERGQEHEIRNNSR